MNCPDCDSEDFYYGDLTGPNCANMHCQNYKGGSVSLPEEELEDDTSSDLDELLKREAKPMASTELDWDEDEEKTPVIGWTEPPEMYLTEPQRTNYFTGFSRDSEATVVDYNNCITVFKKGKIRRLEPVDNWNKYRVKAIRPNPFEKMIFDIDTVLFLDFFTRGKDE